MDTTINSNVADTAKIVMAKAGTVAKVTAIVGTVVVAQALFSALFSDLGHEIIDLF